MEPHDAVRGLMRRRVLLLGFAYAIVRDHHLAEDALQEVASEVLRQASEITDEEHLARWLTRAVRLRAIDAARRRSRGPSPLGPEAVLALEARVAEDAPQGERLDALRACLATLSPYVRRLLALRYGEGLSGAALGQAVGRETNTIYVALARAHKALGACVRERVRRETSDG